MYGKILLLIAFIFLTGIFIFIFLTIGKSILTSNEAKIETNMTTVFLRAFDNTTKNQINGKYIIWNMSGYVTQGKLRDDSASIIRDIPLHDKITIKIFDDDNRDDDYYASETAIRIVKNETLAELTAIKEGFMKLREKEYLVIPEKNIINATYILKNTDIEGKIRYPMYCIGYKNAKNVIISDKSFGENPVPVELQKKYDKCFSRKKPYYINKYEEITFTVLKENETDEHIELDIRVLDKAFYQKGNQIKEGYIGKMGREDIGIPDVIMHFVLPNV